MSGSLASIQRRLFLLLGQAFAIVVGLTILLVILTFSFTLDVRAMGINALIVLPLEGYYAGHNDWTGVETLVTDSSFHLFPGTDKVWQRVILLDAEGYVRLDTGQLSAVPVGRLYPNRTAETLIPLYVQQQRVGNIVVPIAGEEFFRLVANALFPVVIISFFMGILTLLIGLMLMRRVVTPLADVIAAAQAVAAGDLTTRVQVRGPDALRSLNDSFNRMAAALEHNDRERRNLLADVAHELRTPLTIIRGKLEGMVDGIYPPDEAHVAPVLEETYVLERLVEDLRLLTLAESRQLHFDLKPVQLGEVAQHVADLFEAEAAEKNITLAVAAAPDLPTVTADPQRVEQVVGNLVSNALRYVPEQRRVTISVRPCEAGVELAVSDNGPGVSEAELPKIFDRFWRGEKSRARLAGGAGLGLAIARQLVEAQGGSIHARRAEEGGLRVEIRLQ